MSGNIAINEQDLREMYYDYNMSQQAIAGHYGVGQATIWRRMQQYGVQARTRKHSINENFFKVWTSTSAWMYGWSLGDGGYTNPYFLRFGLSPKDKEVLFKFKEILDSEHPVIDCEVWDKRRKKFYKMSKVEFNSREFVSDLRELSYEDEDLTPYFQHFVRGFFEAEGSVCLYDGYIRSNITNNNKEILQYIWDFLIGAGIVEGGSLNLHGDCWLLEFSHYDSIALYHFMYDECGDTFLKRKKEKFEELIE